MAIQLTSARFTSSRLRFNPSVEELIHDCLHLESDLLASNGAVVAYSGKYTGRTPKDKYTVKTTANESEIWWKNNNPMSPEVYAGLRKKAEKVSEGLDLYVIDTIAGADPKYQIKVRFIVERPYHALFIKQLLIRPTAEELKNFEPEWTVIDLGKTITTPDEGVSGDATIALNLEDKEILIFGTEYAGEMKKSIFTVMNYLLPRQGVMSMHCSANVGNDGDVALFFGLSGTGKTTLSADPDRFLIGDDEHGWSEDGVFNIEGGCYAKCIKLSESGEKEIWDAIRHGAVLENVVLSKEGVPDYDSVKLTENTRCAYPLEHIEKRKVPSVGGHPKNIFFLTCDALGVLPPISKLTPNEAMEMFLIGYTAKVAGTEVGVSEPVPSFSACFGQPFLPLPPAVYAKLLKEKLEHHQAQVWLVNTGWTGGPYGVGSRINLKYTRAMLAAAMSGELSQSQFTPHEIFGFDVPQSCPHVPSEILNPSNTWADQDRYRKQALLLKSLFVEHSG